jgi:arylformamidase
MVTSPAHALTVEIGGRSWRVGPQGHDLSIPLEFNAPQPTFFGAPAAAEAAITAGTFVGDVRRGGSCNCSTYTLTPHCNGTHTECVGHITNERIDVREQACEHLSAALLVSVAATAADAATEASDPGPRPGDRLITRTALAAAAVPHDLEQYRALVVRTKPNPASKRHRDYDAGELPPYFSAEAMRWIAQCGIRTLVVDLPSVDRANDEGRLTTHRIFWGLPPGAKSAAQAVRRGATITELAFIDDAIADGPYLLNLQVAPFVTDAAPSRPILFPLQPT